MTLIFNKLQILQITQIEFLMRKRMNFYGFFSPADCADLRRGFSTTDLSSPFKFSKDFQIAF